MEPDPFIGRTDGSTLEVDARPALEATRIGRSLMLVVMALMGLATGCGPRGTVHDQAVRSFTRHSGFPWPQDAKVIKEYNFVTVRGEGETALVFEVDAGTFDKYMSGKPPWGDEWRPGPLPPEVEGYCKFNDVKYVDRENYYSRSISSTRGTLPG